MKCSQCGFENAESSRFCGNCGAVIKPVQKGFAEIPAQQTSVPSCPPPVREEEPQPVSQQEPASAGNENRLRIEIHAYGYEIGWNYLQSLDDIDAEEYLSELSSMVDSHDTENYLLAADCDSGSSLHVFVNDDEVYMQDDLSADDENPLFLQAEEFPDIDTPEGGYTAISRDRCHGIFSVELTTEKKFDIQKLQLVWCCPDITLDTSGIIAVIYDGLRYDLLPETDSNGTDEIIVDYYGNTVYPEEEEEEEASFEIFEYNDTQYKIPEIADTDALVREFNENVSEDDEEACWCHNGVMENCDSDCEICLLCSNNGEPSEKIAAFKAYCEENGINLRE